MEWYNGIRSGEVDLVRECVLADEEVAPLVAGAEELAGVDLGGQVLEFLQRHLALLLPPPHDADEVRPLAVAFLVPQPPLPLALLEAQVQHGRLDLYLVTVVVLQEHALQEGTVRVDVDLPHEVWFQPELFPGLRQMRQHFRMRMLRIVQPLSARQKAEPRGDCRSVCVWLEDPCELLERIGAVDELLVDIKSWQ